MIHETLDQGQINKFGFWFLSPKDITQKTKIIFPFFFFLSRWGNRSSSRHSYLSYQHLEFILWLNISTNINILCKWWQIVLIDFFYNTEKFIVIIMLKYKILWKNRGHLLTWIKYYNSILLGSELHVMEKNVNLSSFKSIASKTPNSK